MNQPIECFRRPSFGKDFQGGLSAGVRPEERERVFDPFYRRDAGAGRGGSGLGLAIARAVVVAHGGRIWIEGAPGGGTAVVFELPAAPDVVVPEERELSS